MARGSGTVVVSIIGKADKLKAALDDSDKQLKGFGGKLESFGKSAMATGAKFTAGLTLPIVGGLGLATKAAAEDAAQQAKLAKTLKNTVGASQEVVKSVEAQISGFMKVSTFADDELRPGYEKLIRSTRDVGEANKLMAQAMDIATATGKPLEAVSTALAKAHDGNVGALTRLGIKVKEHGTLTQEQTARLASLQATIRELTPTVDQLKDRQDELTMSLSRMTPGTAEYKATSEELRQVTLRLKVAQGDLNDSTKEATTLQKIGKVSVVEFDQAMKNAAETFGGSAAAALDTTAGKSAALKRDMGELTEQIGMALIPVLDRLVPMVSKVAEWFTNLSPQAQSLALAIAAVAASVGPLITAIGSLSTALTFLAANPVTALFLALDAAIILAYVKFEPFRNAVNALWDAFRATPLGQLITDFDNFKKRVGEIIDWMMNKVHAVGKVITDTINILPGVDIGGGGGGGGFWGGLKDAATQGLKSVVPGLKWLPFAEGGIVTRPTMGLVGESGPEAVIPLSQLRGGGMGGATVNVYGTLVGADPASLARYLSDLLAREGARGAI